MMQAIITTDPANTLAAQTMQPAIDAFIDDIDGKEKTAHTYLKNLRQFFAWLAYNGITQPTRQDIKNYREYLQTPHDAIQLDTASPAGWSYRTDKAGRPLRIQCKATTAKQYLQAVKQLFKWAAANGYYREDITANLHAPRIRQDAHKKDALTAADILKIENSIKATAAARTDAAAGKAKDTAGRVDRSTEQGKRLLAMYLLAVNAGLRTIELHRANIRDIEVKDGQAYLYIYGKGRDEADQLKPLAAPVYDALRDYIDHRADKPGKDAPLFVATGNRSGSRRLATTTISTMLKRAMQEAGFNSERITAHSLRHTAGNIVMELTGDNLFITQQYMRHASPKTTEIYLHRNTTKEEAQIVARLYSKYHATDAPQEAAQ